MPDPTLLYQPRGSSPGGRATGVPGRETRRLARRRRNTPCGASRNGVAPCGVIHQRGAGKRSATKEIPGRILEPTSCLPAMK